MSINVSGNVLSTSGFTSSGEIGNYPNIVTDGLVLWYDAGNLASYNSSSSYYDCGYGCQYYASSPGCTNCNTQIKDMSGYGNDGTLTNGASVVYDNTGGSVNFDGTNDYVNVLYNSSLNFTSISCLMWIKTPSVYTSSFRAFFSKQGADRDVNFYAYSSAANGVIDNFHLSTTRLTSYPSVVGIPGGSLTLNKWHLVGFTIGGGNINFILNGDIFSSGAYTGTYNANNSYNIMIGAADNYWLGNISTTLVYNKVLSTNEILQNYNAGRRRYGV